VQQALLNCPEDGLQCASKAASIRIREYIGSIPEDSFHLRWSFRRSGEGVQRRLGGATMGFHTVTVQDPDVVAREAIHSVD
jgi:hypothetical protein